MSTLVGMRSVAHYEKAIEDLAQMMEDLHFSLATITEEYGQHITDTEENKLEDFVNGVSNRVNTFRKDVAEKITTITASSASDSAGGSANTSMEQERLNLEKENMNRQSES